MAIPLMPTPPDRQGGAGKRRSLFGKIFRGTGWLAASPVDWFGASRVRRSWSFIGAMAGIIRQGPVCDPKFKTEDAGEFDLRATAFSYGLSVHQLEARLQHRRRQTARIAMVTFVLAWAFFIGWIWQALSSPWTSLRLASALYFMPFCALFFLIAFYNALLNFQIRCGRLATWREYLATNDGFWPS